MPGKHLVLINPPALKGRTNERTLSGGIGVSRRLKPLEKEGTQLLPIDFLYLAAVAERAGAKVTLIDLLLDRRQGAAAERHCTHRVGRSDGSTWIGVRLSMPSLLQDLSFADRIKALLPGCTVFLFGSVIMNTFDHWARQTSADFVLFGEPEAFIDKALAAEDPASVPGVIDPRRYQPLVGDELYDRRKNEERQACWVQVGELHDLPRPAWHLLDMQRYAGSGSIEEVGVFVQASRGCPIGCTMCPYMLLEGKPWRKNDIERVVGELAWLNQTFGIHRVRFRDPNFGFNRKYARALAEALIARGVKLSATVETSLEILDEETLRLMHKAGITTITTGVETNDEACMESIGQRIKVNAKLRERVNFCHSISFDLYGTYCLGAPEETWETVEKTWRFANELDIESGFTVMTPFPSTPLYWRALEEGLLEKVMRFSDWNSYTSTMRTYALTATDLDMARWWARMETILPHRRKRLQPGLGPLARFLIRHLPHFAWRQLCRAYVWFRKRVPGPVVAAPSVAVSTDGGASLRVVSPRG